MSSDVNINNNYPGVEYQGTETGAIYYEDREITGDLYRTQNAQFNKTTQEWSLYDSSLAANAVVQRSDGSVGFLSVAASSAAFTVWSGAPQAGVFNVKDYGATGNGSTNDTSAIQAAFNAVPSAGGVVWFPPGTYLCNTVTTSGTAPTHIRGAGIDTTILRLTGDGATASVVNVNGPGSICDLTLDGNASAQYVLVFKNTTGTIDTASIRNVKAMNNSTSYGQQVVTIFGSEAANFYTNFFIENLIIEGPSSSVQDALNVGYVTNLLLNGLTVLNCYRSPNIYAEKYAEITNVYIYNVSNLYGLVIDGGLAGDDIDQYIVLTNVYIDPTSAPLMLGATDCIVSNSFLGSGIILGDTGTSVYESNLIRITGSYIGGPIVNNNATNFPSEVAVVSCDLQPGSDNYALLDNHPASSDIGRYYFRANSFELSGASGFLGAPHDVTLVNSVFSENTIYSGTLSLESTVSIGSAVVFRNNQGFNPYGALPTSGTFQAPSIGTSGTFVANNTGLDQTVYVTANSHEVTAIKIGGTAGTSTGGTALGITVAASGGVSSGIVLPAGQTISLTYASGGTAPTWVWFGS